MVKGARGDRGPCVRPVRRRVLSRSIFRWRRCALPEVIRSFSLGRHPPPPAMRTAPFGNGVALRRIAKPDDLEIRQG